MNVSLYQAAAAMNANARWEAVIASNLAAASVPGFKKQDISFDAVASGVIPGAAAGPNGAPSRVLLPTAQTSSDFSNGELKYTGVKTDLALQGSGFFEVRLPDGSLAYTRDGEFKIDAQGQLVTQQGYPVLGSMGTVQLDFNDAHPLSVSANGTISQGPNPKGKLNIVDFNDRSRLTSIGAGLFLANNPNLQSAKVNSPSVRQGYLESANTSTVRQMADLITSMRLFEANQKIIQTQDAQMGKAISALGNPS